ncbi:MAG: translation initiation factor IF-6 [Candidatus Micrarchaeota archaeon]|nr:translation initiation factor IF-6 [Candidatus Micrarchaeota archaeon]
MIKISYHGNPYIGIFLRANENVALVPEDAPHKLASAVESRLGVKAISTSLCSSGLLGIYSAMNSRAAIVPHIAYADEVRRIARESGLEVCQIDTKNTAIGNLVACNDYGAIISEAIEPANVRKIADALGVEVVRGRIAGYLTVGSACAATNHGFVMHNDASEEDFELAESVLKVQGINTTVNFGFPFPSYGVVANSKGFVAGEKCTGIELMRVEQGLGLSRKRI